MMRRLRPLEGDDNSPRRRTLGANVESAPALRQRDLPLVVARLMGCHVVYGEPLSIAAMTGFLGPRIHLADVVRTQSPWL